MFYTVKGCSQSIESIEVGTTYKSELKEVKHVQNFSLDLEASNAIDAIEVFKGYNLYPSNAIIYFAASKKED